MDELTKAYLSLAKMTSAAMDVLLDDTVPAAQKALVIRATKAFAEAARAAVEMIASEPGEAE